MAAAAASTEGREEDLVAAAQAGNAQAFEALFRRYRDRIAAFVRANIRDEGRSEDLVQEIFLDAHHSLGTLSHPVAFRSWLYQIARNACLDEVRRRSRQAELIYGWDEFPPPDERIVLHNQDAERMLSQKEELADLTEALDGLPSTQHDALVMRELEGRSYDEIGRKMRLSKTAVESVLFRARRGLKGEYLALQTGERCERMQAVMVEVAEGMGAMRERRKLIRHMRDCAPCRREAAVLGIAGLALPSDDRRGIERAFSRLVAFLPIPAFLSRRGEETDQLAGGAFASQAQGAAAQLSTVGADHVVSVVHKAAVVVAAVAVVGGGGVAMQQAGVDLPVFDSIATHHSKAAGTASREAKAPAKRTAANRPGSARAPAPARPTRKESSGAPPLLPPAAAVPAAERPSSFVSPVPSTTPTADTPGDSTTAPATGGDTGGTAGSGSGTGNGDTGSTKKKPDTGSTNSGGGGTTTTTGGGAGGGSGSSTTTPDSILKALPPGLAKQIESGKRTIDDLPPGQKKKLGALLPAS